MAVTEDSAAQALGLTEPGPQGRAATDDGRRGSGGTEVPAASCLIEVYPRWI